MLDNKPIPIYGDGTMKRDFTYIDDIIDGIQKALHKCKGYNIYNLGESRPVTVNDLIELLENALKTKAIPKRQPEQPGDVKCTYADINRAVKELGYSPETPLEDGLAKFAQWIKQS